MIIISIVPCAERIMEAMIFSQVGMRLRTKKREAKEAQIKKEATKKEKAQIKKIKK